MAAPADVELARALRESVRAHKRSESAHRRQARELMRLTALFCAEHGITLETEGKGERSHSHERARP